MRWLWSTLLLLPFASCSFDARVDAGVKVSCRDSSDCPPDMQCSVTSKVCLFRNPADTVAPVLSATFNTGRLRPGETISLSVTSNEAIIGQPLITAKLTTGDLRPVELDGVGQGALVVPTNEPDGLVSFFGTAEDVAGNGVEGVFLGGVVVDGTPPLPPDVRASPEVVAPGAPVAVTAIFNEEVRSGTVLKVDLPDGGFVSTISTLSSDRLASFFIHLPPGLPDGPLPMRIEHAVDVVGNELEVADAGFVGVDAVPPTITAFDLSTHLLSAVAGFNRLDVTAAADNAVQLVVCLDQTCLDANGGSVGFDVTPADTEGPHAVTVRAFDNVGNQALRTEAVLFDFTPPSPIASTVTYEAPLGCPFTAVTRLGPLGLARATFAVDEPLGASPGLDGGSVPFSPTSSAGQSYTFKSAPGPYVDGAIALTTTLIDRVGNAATRALTAALEVDTVGPAPLDAAHRQGFVYRRAPHGSARTMGQPSFELDALPGSFTLGTAVLVLGGPDPANALVVANIPVNAGGGLDRFALQPLDAPAIYFRQFDEACNPDGALATRVPTVEWLASLGGRRPGLASNSSNHRFVEVANASQLSRRGESREWTTELLRADGSAAVSVGPALRWFTQVGATTSIGQCAGTDFATGELWTQVASATARTGRSCATGVGCATRPPLAPGPTGAASTRRADGNRSAPTAQAPR